ncbi:MAG TPA: PDZ domain-containing protein [Bacteroidota bacterium]|nr:PDZ domain-containing protein [Bacteroidota bacterium]
MKRSFLFITMALLAFAIAIPLSPAVAQTATARSGWLGVSIQDVTEGLMKDKDLKDRDGAYVSEVVEDSPADSAGIKEGDVITEFNGRMIYDASDLSKAVGRTKPGTKATVVLMRKGEKKNLAVVIQKQPRRRGFATFFGQAPRVAIFHSAGRMLGLTLMELNEQLAEYFGARKDQGVLVQEVEKGSTGEKAGVKAGDVLMRIGTRSIEDLNDVSRAIDKYDEGEKVEIEVLRKGAKKTMTVEIEEPEDGPWGMLAPTLPRIPRMELYRTPRMEKFEFDTDEFNNNFQYRVEPKLRELEYKIRTLAPKIEIDHRNLERQIRKAVRVATRVITM